MWERTGTGGCSAAESLALPTDGQQSWRGWSQRWTWPLTALPLPLPLPPLAGNTNASNPYNVGAIQNVAFNNLRCTMVTPTQPQAPAGGSAPAPERPAPQAATPTDVQIEYTPIEYLNQPIVSTFTQFLVRWVGVG